ncbi:MAG: hypothetical protein ACRD2I_17440 [Vicinamibacterales bacterium]
MTILAWTLALTVSGAAGGQAAAPGRADWIALARSGFVLPANRTAIDMLVSMNELLASDDPVLRDEVAYSAAERRIVREHRLSPSDVSRDASPTWRTRPR